MREYMVHWSIELTADSPEEAARQALEIQRDPDSLATVFHVMTTASADLREQVNVSVDLAELDGHVA